MAVYHTLDDVKSRLPRQIADITPSSEPDDQQVNQLMDEVESFVNAQLAGRYQLPVSGSQSLQIVKSICADLVAARVWRMKAAGVNDPTQLQYAEQLEKSAMERLKALADGTAQLPDQPEAIDSSTPSGTLPIEPIVKIDERQW